MDDDLNTRVEGHLLHDYASPHSGYGDLSSASTTVATPSSPAAARHRPGYTRLSSISTNDHAYNGAVRPGPDQAIDDPTSGESQRQGLGLSRGKTRTTGRRVSGQPFARVSVDSKARFFSPLSSSADSSFSAGFGSPEASFGYETHGIPEDHEPHSGKVQPNNSPYQGHFITTRDSEALLGKSTASIKSYADFSPSQACPSHKPIAISRASWLWFVLLALSIFSTVFSGLYLAIAIRGPRYGGIIHQDRSFSISTATVLFAVFAKLIELSFVTVAVAFLGQVISRKAFMRKHGKGITLAEMSMRSWIMQPGSMVTHVESVRFGLFSILGILAMIAAWVSMLYTSASAALVSPQLSFGDYEPITLQGLVKTSYANAAYTESICYTPIKTDSEYAGDTCMAIEHAAQSYFNYYETFLKRWTAISNSGNGTSDLRTRPAGTGLLNENITVTGSWVEMQDMSKVSSTYGNRIINNVSLAMPHPGLLQASLDPINHVVTPEGDQGLGVFNLRASVPSPVVHVLCVNASEEELGPLVYDLWEYSQLLNASSWPAQAPTESNSSVFDDLFGWGPDQGRATPLQPPIFPRLPADYNTITNHTVGTYGDHDGIYLLGKTGPDIGTDVYALCSLRSSLTPFCSTRYNATSSGGTMEAHCEDPKDSLQYINSLSNATSGNGYVSIDWTYIASLWGLAVNLNSGITDGKAANARLLMQLMPTSIELNPALPSIAESLAVMAGNTLLISAQDTPFLTFWNYTSTGNVLDPGQYQYINATIRSQQYASGAAFQYQKGFYIVLAAVFVGNLLILAYLIYHNGLVTDYAEPPNLFSLSINSPPSTHFAGSCGGGPDGKQYKVNWFVNVDGEHVYLESEDRSANNESTPQVDHNRDQSSPLVRMYSTLSKRRSIL